MHIPSFRLGWLECQAENCRAVLDEYVLGGREEGQTKTNPTSRASHPLATLLQKRTVWGREILYGPVSPKEGPVCWATLDASVPAALHRVMHPCSSPSGDLSPTSNCFVWACQCAAWGSSRLVHHAWPSDRSSSERQSCWQQYL